MFGIKYRYLFILLLTIYSYFNLQFTVGESLLTKQFTGAYLFLALSIVVLFVWELNRIAELLLSRLRNTFFGRIHPLIVLFSASLINVVLASAIALLTLETILG